MSNVRNRFILSVLVVSTAVSVARADDLDVTQFEYVDVVETYEGSVWKGVVTEQTPNVQYKIATADGSLHVIRAADVVRITKQRNPKYRIALATDTPELVDSVRAPARSRGSVRIDPELAILMPAGDMLGVGGTRLDYRTSVAPGARVGYELNVNGIDVGFGGLARFTSWRLPTLVADAGSHWTLETHVYGRAALPLGRIAPYAGLSFGLDTNHTHSNLSDISSMEMGFGMNVQSGMTLSITPAAAVELGIDYHPGTDTIESGVDASVSYFAFRLGAAIRL